LKILLVIHPLRLPLKGERIPLRLPLKGERNHSGSPLRGRERER